jgi:hypothetical protein
MNLQQSNLTKTKRKLSDMDLGNTQNIGQPPSDQRFDIAPKSPFS